MKTFYSLIKKTSGWRMKSVMLFVAACFFSPIINAQLVAGAPANFGIDGDVRNDFRMSGTFTAAGTHDWFKLTAGTGIGVIDTTNKNSYIVALATGNNIQFNKGMTVPRYSTVDGKLLLDARYGRDQFGNGSAAATMDFTAFPGGQKNDMNPTTWVTAPAGISVGAKADIIDAYMHMRRDGTNLSTSNPSRLIANIGISTSGVTGTRYFDAELFCSKIAYNTTTGVFSNSGPAGTGGRTTWIFNPDGSVSQFGDMTISFAFSSSTCDEIFVLVWVPESVFLSVNPAGFDFVPGAYYGASGGYGYARIKPNSGSEIAWGVGNTIAAITTPWGTTSSTLGNHSLNDYSTSYDVGQFGEASIDLTALGVDPLLIPGGNACTSPFTRILFKSRSSSSFSSSLQDFAGPYPFLDAPQPPKNIIAPGILTCTNSSLTLQPQTLQEGAAYRWTTSGGSIPGNPVSSSITVTQPGKYYLYSSAFVGCNEQVDSVIVGQDIHKPVASIQQTSVLYTPNALYDSVTLLGGNIAASNYTSAYGSFQGLLWSWTGSNGLNATTQNVIVSDSGYQRLIVTNISNGCKDTAGWYLMDLARPPLSVNLVSFTAALNNSKVDLQWSTTSEKNASHFVIEKSINGKDFTDVGTVTANGTTVNQSNYNFQDNTGSYSGVIYYRLRQVELSGKTEYSETRIVRTGKQSLNTVAVLLYPNPATDEVRITIPNKWQNKKVVYELYNASGQIAKRMETANSSQTETLNIMSLSPGFYIMRVSCDGVVAQQKIIKN